jgi:hypothetical protein
MRCGEDSFYVFMQCNISTQVSKITLFSLLLLKLISSVGNSIFICNVIDAK